MPDVWFMFKGADDNDYWTQWLPKDYMIENGDYEECTVCIYPHDSTDLVIGSSFLRGYYAKFDKTAATIGLVPNSESSKKDLELGTAPVRLRGFDVAIVAGLSSGMAVLLGLFLWMVIGIFCLTMKRASKKKTETVQVDANLIEQLTAMLEAKKRESGQQQQQLTNVYQTNSIE